MAPLTIDTTPKLRYINNLIKSDFLELIINKPAVNQLDDLLKSINDDLQSKIVSNDITSCKKIADGTYKINASAISAFIPLEDAKTKNTIDPNDANNITLENFRHSLEKYIKDVLKPAGNTKYPTAKIETHIAALKDIADKRKDAARLVDDQPSTPAPKTKLLDTLNTERHHFLWVLANAANAKGSDTNKAAWNKKEFTNFCTSAGIATAQHAQLWTQYNIGGTNVTKREMESLITFLATR